MTNWRTIAIKAMLPPALIAVLATLALAQERRAMEYRAEHTKVPAVIRTSYDAAEDAPALVEQAAGRANPVDQQIAQKPARFRPLLNWQPTRLPRMPERRGDVYFKQDELNSSAPREIDHAVQKADFEAAETDASEIRKTRDDTSPALGDLFPAPEVIPTSVETINTPPAENHWQSSELGMQQGPLHYEPIQAGCTSCGQPACGGGCCNTACGPNPCHAAWENLSVFGGVQAFKSPVDQGVNGNFGFHEGANWSGPVFEYGGIGGQIGIDVVQSNLSGGTTFEDHRTQTFFTTGLFHRPLCGNGWQGGIVWDWLHDDFYVNMNVSQLRSELSWISCNRHEFGFWSAIGVTSDSSFSNVNNGLVGWQPLDMYALFYRKYFNNGAVGRFSAGCTGEGEGLIGADAMAPLTRNVAVQGNFNYRIGDNRRGFEDAAVMREGWGLTISLVWFPGYKSPCSSRNPYRPMFNVADNTTLFLNHSGATIR